MAGKNQLGTGSESQSIALAVSSLIKKYPFLIIFALVTVRFLYRRYASPLRAYPGPLLASGSRLWKVITVARGNTHLDHVDVHRKFGKRSVVRTGPNELSFSSPEAAREILSPGKGFHKTDFYWVFPPAEHPDIFTEIQEDVHARKKRVAVGPYSMGSLQLMTPWINETIIFLTDKIDAFAESKQQMDFGAWLHYFAFDVLGEVAFSKSFGFLEQGKDVEGAIKAIDEVQLYDGIVGQVPFLHYFLRLNPVLPYLPFMGDMSQFLITRMALRELQTREKNRDQVDRRDLLEQLLEANEKDSSRLSSGDIFAIIHGAIGAGSDSTASTMQSFFYHVLATPGVYEKLTSEVLNADRSGDLGTVVGYDEAQKLSYFQACLKEAMRLQPAVGLSIYRRVPQGGAEIEGTWIPGGTEVAVNGWVLHRDRDIFGDDADRFRPERWLVNDGKAKKGGDHEEEEKRIKRMDRHMFQFGGGSHVCIGRNLALLEINKVVPQLLRRYKFELAYPGRPMKGHSTFFYIQTGLDVKVTKRV